MGSLDGTSLCVAGSEDCANEKGSHRRKKKSSVGSITSAYVLGEAFTDEADTVCDDYLQRNPVSYISIPDDAIPGHRRHSKHRIHKNVKNLRNSESDGSEIKDAACVMQREEARTDVEKESQSFAELEGCNRIGDSSVQRKKRKKNNPCNADCTSFGGEVDMFPDSLNSTSGRVHKKKKYKASIEGQCQSSSGSAVSDLPENGEVGTLFPDNLSSTSGRVRKKKKYKASVEGQSQSSSGPAVSDLRENCRDGCSTFSDKSDGILSDAGGNQNCTLQIRTPLKKKRREVAKEHFQEGTSCSSAQQMDDCENNETCRSVDDSQCCSTGAVCKKKTRKLKPTAECVGSSDCTLSIPTEEPSDNASFLDAAGESSEVDCELKKQSERSLGKLPLMCNDGDCSTREHSSTQKVALKKRKRKLTRLPDSEAEFCTDSMYPDGNLCDTARNSSDGEEVTAPKNAGTVPSVDSGSASKNHGQATSGTRYKIMSSGSYWDSVHASRSLRAALCKYYRSDSPPGREFSAYANGEQGFPSIHHKTKPSLEAVRCYEEETGLTVDTGKYRVEEDYILLNNIRDIAKCYNIAYPHMIVGHCGDQDPGLQKEVKDLVRKEKLIRLMGKGLPRRTVHSIYMRARLLLDPLNTPGTRNVNLEQKELLQQMYSQLGPKWTVMAQRLGLPAEHLRSAFRYVKEKEAFAVGKWKESEDELLRQAVRHQTHSCSVKPKDINWKTVSQHVQSRNASQCKRRWTLIQLLPQPDQDQETQKWDKFDSIHLIYIMYKLNPSRSADVDWEAIGKSFSWAQSSLIAKYHWESTLNHFLPPEQRDSFNSKVRNLYKIALPSLLQKYGKGKTLKEIISLSKASG